MRLDLRASANAISCGITRAELIRELAIPPRSGVGATTTGFYLADIEPRIVRLYDHDLNPTGTIAIPPGRGPAAFTQAADGSIAVFATLEDTVAVDTAGNILWHQHAPISRRGLPQSRAVHLDHAGLLWTYIPNGDELTVHRAADGTELARTPLTSRIGSGHFLPHPDRQHIGLTVAQGQDRTDTFWARYDHHDGLTIRHGPGERLTGISSTGEFYLDLAHDGNDITIRRFTDDTVIVGVDELPGYDWDSDEYFLRDASLITDDLILVNIEADHDADIHLLIDAHTLQPIGPITYDTGAPPTGVTAAGHGRWLTDNWPDGPTRLWQIHRPQVT